MSESTLWRWLRTANHIDGVHLHRIEDSTKRGTPDVEGCIWGTAFWLELKSSRSVQEHSRLRCEPLKPQQVSFVEERLTAGGNVWLLYQVGRERLLAHGRYARALAPVPRLGELRQIALPVLTVEGLVGVIVSGVIPAE